MTWILCSERLPELNENVLFIASKKSDYNYEGDKEHFQNIQFVGFFEETDYIRCVLGDGWTPFNIDELIAWMPLPLPPASTNLI